MIKELNYEINGENKKIEFGKKNYLIGPKGGGKTTLLKLLWNISHNRQTSKGIREAYKNKLWNVDIKKVNIDGANIDLDNLTDGDDFGDDDSSDFEDIVLQNDSLKVSIDSSKKFREIKSTIIEEGIMQCVEDFTPMIQSLAERINRIIKIKGELNVNPTFLDGLGSDQTSLISNFGDIIKPNPDLINKELTNLAKLSRNIDNVINSLDAYKDDDMYVKKYFDKDFNKETSEVIKKLHDYKNHIDSNVNNLNNINNKVLREIEVRAQSLVNSERASASDDEKKSIDRNNFKNNVSKLFKEITSFKKEFMKFQNFKKITLNKELSVDGYSNYKFAISKTIEFDIEEMGDILNKFLYAPTTRADYINWIDKNVTKGSLRNEPVTTKVLKAIKKTFGESIEEATSLFIGDTNYSSLSLGQRSITMLLNKMDRNPENYFFVDQPEDNLDNKTIYEEIVKKRLLNVDSTSYSKQLFVVTHNANIGMLGFNPATDKIIYADLLNGGYSESNIEGNETSAVSILEGGKEPLRKRMDTLKGDN